MTQEEKAELVRYRINRAKETLVEVEFQVENGNSMLISTPMFLK